MTRGGGTPDAAHSSTACSPTAVRTTALTADTDGGSVWARGENMGLATLRPDFRGFGGKRFHSLLHLPPTPLAPTFIHTAPLAAIPIPCMGVVCLPTRTPTYGH